MTALRPLFLALGLLLIALPCLAAAGGDASGKVSLALPATQAMTPAQPESPGKLKLPLDPTLGAVAMTCNGNFTSSTQVATAATCGDAQSALITSLTAAANADCAPGTACNLGFAFKIMDPGACTVSGVVLYGCTGSGGGGGGGGHGGPPDP
ncbi:MAG TPA: hypothetical protein VF173_00660 [Thermoanaerobaculia bacterium]|nr:hypothetical protein [Thermoanaerobaculia bacterium]